MAQKTLSEKLIESHLIEGKMIAGEEITINLDNCLLQDATGTAAWLEFEAIGVPKVKPAFCIQYIDHNLLQVDYKNMDDHLFLMTVASKHGAFVSMPSNGISHHVHKERFTKPGQTMIGCDSHTSTSGAAGMLAIGVGGLDVAVGMATQKFTFEMPKIVEVKLTGKLRDWVTAQDVILEVLRRINVSGGKKKILEYTGDGVKTLSMSERSTIANMGAETGATTSVFPTDEKTKQFFAKQQREKDFVALSADENCTYADTIEINLSELEPLVAAPFSPGNVKHIREVAGLEVSQAMIGSSTNSSYEQFMNCAQTLEENAKLLAASYHVIPGSRQVLATVERDGGLTKFIKNGARISEPSCNACIGIGNAPATETNSIRSFPRNWEGRSGTEHDQVYLASPETCTASGIKGQIFDPRELGFKFPKTIEPKTFVIDDRMIVAPKFGEHVRLGPNIKRLPEMADSTPNEMTGGVVIKLGDDISTDHILPGGEQIMALRSNPPAISEYMFVRIDKDFVRRVKEMKGGFIVGGANYGQGSSREHAAIAPKFWGIKAVLAIDFARIHRSNLINFGILPVTFSTKSEYEKIKQGDHLEIKNIQNTINNGNENAIEVLNKTTGQKISCKLKLQEREKEILKKGNLLNYIKQMQN